MPTTDSTPSVRPTLPPMPPRIARLPRCPKRLIPVPWFVAWLPTGEPEFRMADPEKFVLAVRDRRCWVCGEPLGRNMTFTLGCMCGINRNSAEPPCHLDCAEYSVKACPFLTKPHMTRREDDFTEAVGVDPPGEFIKRNPGVTLLWTTRTYRPFRDRGGYLIEIGDPEHLSFWREGRRASRREVLDSVGSGLPLLEAEAAKQPGAEEVLGNMVRRFLKLVPAE